MPLEHFTLRELKEFETLRITHSFKLKLEVTTTEPNEEVPFTANRHIADFSCYRKSDDSKKPVPIGLKACEYTVEFKTDSNILLMGDIVEGTNAHLVKTRSYSYLDERALSTHGLENVKIVVPEPGEYVIVFNCVFFAPTWDYKRKGE